MGKPFNPLLGETYELERPDFRILCEQVSIKSNGIIKTETSRLQLRFLEKKDDTWLMFVTTGVKHTS